MVTDHQHHVSDSNPKRSVINASNTVTEMSNNLVMIVENQNERQVACHYQEQLATCSEGIEWKSESCRRQSSEGIKSFLEEEETD